MHYFGGFCFDEAHGLLWQEGIRVPLTAKAAGVLACLIDASDRALSKEEILGAALGTPQNNHQHDGPHIGEACKNSTSESQAGKKTIGR